MTVTWRELIFPAAVIGWIALYWLQLDGAPRAARVVPVGTMLMLLPLVLAIVVRDGLGLLGRTRAGAAQALPGVATLLLRYWREAAYVLLSIVYFVVFRYLGFHVANVVFLALAFMVSGNRPLTIGIGTVATTAVIYGAATLMQFNLPTPLLFR